MSPPSRGPNPGRRSNPGHRRHESLEQRRDDRLKKLRRLRASRRQAPPLARGDEPLPSYAGEWLGQRRVEKAANQVAWWHARYTEWTEVLDWLRSRLRGEPERAHSPHVDGLGGLQAFAGLELCDRDGNLLAGPEGDQELAARVLRGLHAAADAAGPGDPALLWKLYVVDGRTADQAAGEASEHPDGHRPQSAGGTRRNFDRWTWRGGLGAPEDYPARKADGLRDLLNQLEQSLERPSDEGGEGGRGGDGGSSPAGLPRSLLTNRVGDFVGRQAELDALAEEWEAARDGAGSVVVVAGEAGIGKSELIYEFCRSTVDAGGTVVASRPSLSGTRPRAEVVDLVRQLSLLLSPTARVRAVDDTGRRSLDRLAPGLLAPAQADNGDAGPIGPPAPAGPSESANPAVDLAALHQAVADLLRQASHHAPVAIVVEDLHAATPDSLDVVSALVEERIPRAMLLLTYRVYEPGQEAVERLLAVARSTGRFRTLTLRALVEGDVVRLARGLPGAAEQQDLGPAIFRTTAGHPFFATSLLKAVQRGEALTPTGQLDPSNLPEEIAQHITWQVGRLSGPAQEVLQAAAVIGARFRLDLLAGAGGRPVDELVRPLSEVEGAGLVTSVGERSGRARFSHELTRDVVYSQLSGLHRARLHRAVAETMRANFTDQLAVSYARHCYEAVEAYPEMRRQAVDASVAAGRACLARMAYGDAVGHYHRALDHARSDEEWARVRAGLGRALASAGDLGEAQRELARAAPIARGLGDAELFAEIVTKLAEVAYQSSAGDPNLRALCQEALTMLPEEEVFWRVRLLAAVARETSPLLAPQVLPEIAEVTLKLASRDDNPATRAYGYHIKHDALLGELDVTERTRTADQMTTAAEAANDPYLLCVSHGHRLVAGLELADPALVRRAIEACEAAAERFPYPYADWQAALYRAGCALYQRPTAEARAAVEHAHLVGERLEYGEVGLMYQVQLAYLRREVGRVEDNEPFISEGAKTFEMLAWTAAYGCGLCEAADLARRDEALPLLEEFERIGVNLLPRDGTYPLTLSFLAQIYAYLADERGAGVLLPVVRACGRRHPVAAGSATYWGTMDYYLGLLHATLGQHDEAVTCFETAYAIDARMDAALWTCHTQVAHAQTLRARDQAGDLAQAQQLEAQARETAATMGYVRIEQELDGHRPPHIPAGSAGAGTGRAAGT